MHPARHLLVLGTLVVALLTKIGAFECGDDTHFIISNPGDIEDKLAGCTTWIGQILINRNWTGPFILSKITDVTNIIKIHPEKRVTNDSDALEWLYDAPNITSFEARSLVTMESLSLQNVPALTSVSLPELELVNQLVLELNRNSAEGARLNFPALKNVTSRLDIVGNISSMNFDRLVGVDGGLSMTSNEDVGDGHTDIGNNPPIVIDFPSLVNTTALTLIGNFSRVSFPALAMMPYNPHHTLGYRGIQLYIAVNANPLDISFPSLWNLTAASLSGTMKSISFPSLRHLNGELEIEPSLNMSVDLSPLESADSVRLKGAISGFNLDSLKSINKLYVDTTKEGSCGPALKTWQRTHPAKNDHERSYYGYYCSWDAYRTPPKPFPKLQVGLGLGIGLPVFLFFILSVWDNRRRARKENDAKNQAPPPAYETELMNRGTGEDGDILPVYELRTSEGLYGRTSRESDLSDMARPPGYEAYHMMNGERVDGREGERGDTR